MFRVSRFAFLNKHARRLHAILGNISKTSGKNGEYKAQEIVLKRAN